jgi:aspartyl-tRNA(Asn)/glutamyl-tRNA(Gln) amidotransferase subunit C
MSVTIKDVDKIAQLAKLKFKENEKVKLQSELNKILEYIDQTENVLRKDEIEIWLTNEEALRNAPSKTGKFFKVPKVLDK